MAGQDSKGRYIQPDESLAGANVASAARTASGEGTAFDTSSIDSVSGSLVVTAASGDTPTLDVTLDTTADGTNFYSVSAFGVKTAITAADAKVFTGLGSSSKWVWNIAGDTPSFTFAITSTVDIDD